MLQVVGCGMLIDVQQSIPGQFDITALAERINGSATAAFLLSAAMVGWR